MKKKLNIFLKLWIILNFILFILSIINVRNNFETVTFITWAYSLGAFIWEDLLIFSIYNIIACLITFLFNDFRFILIFPICFWFIRSLGETFYWFLQQFHEPDNYPLNKYSWSNGGLLKLFLGDLSNQKYFIIHQISWQVISVLCLVDIIWVFKNWKYLGKKLNN